MTGTDSDRAHLPLLLQQAARQMTRTGTDRAHLLLIQQAAQQVTRTGTQADRAHLLVR